MHHERQLLTHAPAGPVKDMLATRSGVVPQGTSDLSEDVARRLYKKSAVNASALAACTPHPHLLEEWFSRERRITVIRAIASNPLLPLQGADELLEQARTTSDGLLLASLLRGRGGTWALAALAANRGMLPLLAPDDLFAALVGHPHPDTIALVKEVGTPDLRADLAMAWRAADLDLDLVLEVSKGASFTASPAYTNFIRSFSGPENWSVLLERLRLRAGLRQVFTEALESRDADGILEALSAASQVTRWNREIPTLLQGLRQSAWPVDVRLARLIVTHPHTVRQERTPLTPADEAAAAVLASAGGNAVRARYASFVTDPALLAPILKAASEFNTPLPPRPLSEVESLFAAGIPAEHLARLLAESTSTGALTPPLRSALLASAELRDLSRFSLSAEDATLLLGRLSPDHPESVSLALSLLRSVVLDATTRRGMVASLPPNQRESWLLKGFLNPPSQGDLAALEALDAPLPTHRASRLPLVGAWFEEHLERTPAPWTMGWGENQVHVERWFSSRLHSSLGEDLPAWENALTLAETWSGTAEELIAVALTV